MDKPGFLEFQPTFGIEIIEFGMFSYRRRILTVPMESWWGEIIHLIDR